MEQLFAILFKYRWFYFREGDFSFQGPITAWQLALVILAVSAALLLLYRKQLRSRRRALSLWALRTSFITLLMLLVMRPSLTLSTLAPQQALVAILADNSSSMGIADSGQVRGEPMTQLLAEDSAFLTELGENFQLRLLRFGRGADRLESLDELDWSAQQTNISAGLERVLTETKNLPLGGIILISDGADNSYRKTDKVLGELKSRKIPIHTVGLGPETLKEDVEVVQVSFPRQVLPGSVAVARVTLRQTGFGGARGTLEVREGSTLVNSTEVYFSPGSGLATTEVQLYQETEGIREYEFEFRPLQGEEILENNQRQSIIRVDDSKPKVLMVEGRPRWEYKFLRQALSDDKNIHLESLLRTALNKFYRQGIEEETTLATGFPTEREELFSYKALLIGDVESAFFTYGQMEMIQDFVSKRGGGLLMMGGGSTLSEGGYTNTPVEEVLPVWLENPGQNGEPGSSNAYLRAESRIVLTQFGEHHPALQLALDAPENQAIWRELPSVSDHNLVRDVKPGATVLAHTVPEGNSSGSQTPLLVFHRYGRGLGLVFLSGSSWRWQMLQEHENMSHEVFWRQILRWLATSAKDQVAVELDREIYSQNEPIQIRAEVSDPSFTRVNNAKVEATIVSPSGQTAQLPLRWNPEQEGVYTGDWSAKEDGLHRIEVSASPPAGPASQIESEPEPAYGSNETFFLARTGQAEFFDPVQKKSYLEWLAEETGGRYYSGAEVWKLPEEIVFTESQASVTRTFELWDMPINFLLLIGLLFADWVFRKRWGMV
jgi:uncharacterized membrane protein